MEIVTSKPHDRLFKEMFSRREVVISYIENFIPKKIVSNMDLSTLEISKDSFISKDLKELYSDILYKTYMKDGSDVYVYLLFEHKSYVDKFIPFQLLKSMIAVWEFELKRLREEKKSLQKAFVPILPIALYHGEKKWSVNKDFQSLFLNLNEDLKDYLPNFNYLLLDSNSEVNIEEVKLNLILRIFLVGIKIAHSSSNSEEVISNTFALLEELSDKNMQVYLLEVMIRYFVVVTKEKEETKI